MAGDLLLSVLWAEAVVTSWSCPVGKEFSSDDVSWEDSLLSVSQSVLIMQEEQGQPKDHNGE
jgi:hypothetical protein